ncbi:MAG: FkbM family methyltransferase, partial [Chloroflexi bacterium]|nr:FkbM family methyltransferase [Chloroflexota bacterium]
MKTLLNARELAGRMAIPFYWRHWRKTASLSGSLLASPFYWRFLRFGVAAALEHEAILRQQKAATILDIGANRGQFAVVARRCFPQARILSFEPIDQARLVMQQLFGADPLFESFPCALGSLEGTAALHLSRHEPSSSLLPMCPSQGRIYPGTEETGLQMVSVRRLDQVLAGRSLDQPVLCKIDVQGTEKEVIAGFGALAEAVGVLLIEVSLVEFYFGQALFPDLLPTLS